MAKQDTPNEGTNTDPAQEPTINTPEIGAMSIRCKFQLVNKQDLPGAVYQERVYLSPVTGVNADGSPNENASFARQTPSGVLELLVENEEIRDFFQAGKMYYLDITEA